MYKVLIVDDNHSFIDSLKSWLSDFTFHYSSFFRFEVARADIEKNGNYLNFEEYKKLKEFESNVLVKEISKKDKKSEEEADDDDESSDLSNIKLPEVNEVINNNGYLFVFVEQDTENNLKGIDFIENIMKVYSGWDKINFVLMTSNIAYIKERAERLGISVIEKTMKPTILKSFIAARLKEIEEIKSDVSTLYKSYLQMKEEIKPVPVKKKSRKRKTVTTEEQEETTKTVKKKTSQKKTTARRSTTKTSSKASKKITDTEKKNNVKTNN